VCLDGFTQLDVRGECFKHRAFQSQNET
jgi:hypothetical protein